MTVNCARIIHANQVATNGVVHVVDRVITVAANTIKEVLETRNELSSFSVRIMTGTPYMHLSILDSGEAASFVF